MLDFVVNKIVKNNVCNNENYQFLSDDTSNLKQHSCFKMGLGGYQYPYHDHTFRVDSQQNIVVKNDRFDCDDVSSWDGNRSGSWLFYVR